MEDSSAFRKENQFGISQILLEKVTVLISSSTEPLVGSPVEAFSPLEQRP